MALNGKQVLATGTQRCYWRPTLGVLTIGAQRGAGWIKWLPTWSGAYG